MKKLLGTMVALVFLAGAFVGGIWYARRAPAPAAKGGRKVLYWVDPMHPAYKSDKPGIAPDCGMKLEPVYEEGSAPVAEASKRVLRYQDPKDPKYNSDKPGINPETGEDLVPVYEGSAESMPAGTINVSADKQQTIGVAFATVEPAAGASTIRANGRVTQDETKVTRIHPKIEGWIHKVDVDFTGQLVKAGDPLLTLYSPEMLASEQEFLLALRARDSMKSSPSREAYENSEILIEAARRRLELWDLSAAQISELEHTRKTIRTVTLYSPAAGYVMSRNAFPSQRVTPETELYAISDLSRVWIMADVFESDIPKVHLGQPATIAQPFAGGIDIPAKVTYVQPQVDPATRTLKVRLEAPNANMRLKPDMFVNVEFRLAAQGGLTVPAGAVVNTGLRKTVFVDRGNGYLEPRAVETGESIGDRVQIVKGLRAGERVVASGAFLIDSEAQLKNPGGVHD